MSLYAFVIAVGTELQHHAEERVDRRDRTDDLLRVREPPYVFCLDPVFQEPFDLSDDKRRLFLY